MASPKHDSRSTHFIGPLKNEHMKTHAVRDASERVILLYEAPRHVQHGQECLVTVYEYTTANNVPTNTLEKVSIWDASWEAAIDAVLVNGDLGYTEL